MRNITPRFVLLAALFLTSFGPPARSFNLPQAALVERPMVEVKLKCFFDENGNFGCKNVNKNNDSSTSSNSTGSASSGAAKCRGKNNCGPGYRDLDFPNKYGACCEQIPAGSNTNDTSKPKTGGCRSVEKQNQMSCSPPFDAISCGAVQANNTMTCCCVK